MTVRKNYFVKGKFDKYTPEQLHCQLEKEFARIS